MSSKVKRSGGRPDSGRSGAAWAGLFLVAVMVLGGAAAGRPLTLGEALDKAVGASSRSGIIEGDLEVAQLNYRAERTGFYIPKVSLNGSLPVYNVEESFRFFGGQDQKSLTRTTDLNFRTNLQLEQSLITGGALTIRGNIWNSQSEYPIGSNRTKVFERTTQGIFDFTLSQPILQPSQNRFDLHNSRDDLVIAEAAAAAERAQLQIDVATAYFDVLQNELKSTMAEKKLAAASRQTEIDSLRFLDGVVSEDGLLEASSKRLDAELELIESRNNVIEANRELALLLDVDVNESIEPSTPDRGAPLSEKQRLSLVNGWEETLPIRKAQHEFEKAQRQADFHRSQYGVTGTLEANYNLGRGDVEVDGESEDNNTNSWEVSLNFTYPIWDGGATRSGIRANDISASKAELEYQRARRSTRAEIVDLLNRLDISYRKLEVLQKQTDLLGEKLRIARERHADGQISEIELLNAEVARLEGENKYLDELRKYLVDKLSLGKYRAI